MISPPEAAWSIGDHDLPDGWGIATVGELFNIQQGKALSAAARTAPTRYPFLRTSNVFWSRLDLTSVDQMGMSDQERAKLGLDTGDLLVCEGGEIGRSAIWTGAIDKCYFRNHLHRLRPRSDQTHPPFYAYWFQLAFTCLGVYEGAGTRTTIANLSGGRLARLMVPVPPLATQMRIVRSLDAIRDVQDRTARCSRATTTVQDALLASAFPKQIDDAQRELFGGPSTWSDCTVGDQLAVQRGFDITKKQQRPGAVPVISSSGPKTWHDEAKVEAPGVVIGRKGSLGTAFFSDIPFWPHDTTLWVTDFKGNNPRYVYYFLRQLDVSHLDVGASNPTLNRNHLYPQRVIWPDTETQARIVSGCASLQAYDNRLRALERDLETTFRSFLYSLFARDSVLR